MSRSSEKLSYRHLFFGLDVDTPLLGGERRKYINLDNAASTPPFLRVQKAVNDFMVYYSSVHRGTGFKSQLSTHAYEESRQIVLRFVGADASEHSCIFGKNTTDAINKLAKRFPFSQVRNVVVTSGMEHHSNDLPWRANTKTVHVSLTPDGHLDMENFDQVLAEYGDRVALVAISGASNVTGFLNDIHTLAEKAHSMGAHILVDCAQLAPHRTVRMGKLDDPKHLDYVAISAHKMYAPFGSGALIGRLDTFAQGDPDQVGGGTVEIVTLEDVTWAEPPDRDEAGSPNTVGAIALATAILQFEEIGMEAVARHEADLTAYALEQLKHVKGIRIFGDANPQTSNQRLGVIPFQLETHSHFLVSAVLGHEFGIGVRSGCFCAHPYILKLLGLSASEAAQVRDTMLGGDKSSMPGLVRASFGLYNTTDEVDEMVWGLDRIRRNDFNGQYMQERSTGEFHPVGWQPDFQQYFVLQ